MTEPSKAPPKAGSKRDAIRRKVKDSQAQLTRSTPAGKAPPEGLRAVAMDYPFSLMLGGVALGLVAGVFLPRAIGKRLGTYAGAAGAIAAEVGMAYAKQALDKAGNAAERIETIGESARGAVGEGAAALSGKASGLIADVGRLAADAARDALATSREASNKISRQAIRLRSHLRH